MIGECSPEEMTRHVEHLARRSDVSIQPGALDPADEIIFEESPWRLTHQGALGRAEDFHQPRTIMYRKGWLRRGRIYSDEGFSVGILDRTTMVYRESKRKMTIPGEILLNGFALYKTSIGPWDDGEPIDENKRSEIANRIIRALESQGMSAEVD